MVNVNQMIKFISEQFRINDSTAKQSGRYARENGYLSQAGHGRGAAKATARDAASMCIALVLCPSPFETPSYIRDFGYLRLSGDSGSPQGHYFDEFEPAQTLLGALADLFTWLADPAFAAAAARHARGNKAIRIMPEFRVQFGDSSLYGKIWIDGTENTYVHESISSWTSPYSEVLPPEETQAKAELNAEKVRRYHRGYTSIKIIEQDALIAIAECINGVSFRDLFVRALEGVTADG